MVTNGIVLVAIIILQAYERQRKVLIILLAIVVIADMEERLTSEKASVVGGLFAPLPPHR